MSLWRRSVFLMEMLACFDGVRDVCRRRHERDRALPESAAPLIFTSTTILSVDIGAAQKRKTNPELTRRLL
jgi:hypothetical protein